MANDITSINSSRLQQSGSRQSQRLDEADSKGSSSNTSRVSSDGADKVSLTSTAARLKDIEQRLASQTPVDQNRVKQVKSAINNGEYNVDADRVANKMINFENSLHS
ncbi:MAG TPA: flagellar biosynthesis anti-sigma factor FlgM [Gammaproteobacteria bacterium]|nr:flagellar biosynthesis anti-sigma factor FlgM [Gammaproteobacteria bacterium]